MTTEGRKSPRNTAGRFTACRPWAISSTERIQSGGDMAFWRCFAILSMGFLASCATIDVGVSSYNSGRYDEAYDTFQQCAQEGEPACYYNMALMHENGTAPRGGRRHAAIEYYKLAARYGVPAAQSALIRLGEEVPDADLQGAYELRRLEQQAAQNRAFSQLGCALGGGTDCYASPSSSTARVVEDRVDCYRDSQCGTGETCVRPEGTYGAGQCATLVNEYGVRDYSPGTGGVRDVKACTYDGDCSIGFRCSKRGAYQGVCIKSRR